MSESMSTRQAAEVLGVSPRTLRQWLRTIPISVAQDEAGEYVVTRSDLERLALIRAWRASGKSLRELRERILEHRAQKPRVESPSVPDPEEVSVEPAAVTIEPERDSRTAYATAEVETLVQALVPAVMSAIREDTQRAERFAQLAHRVGELEATLRERDREIGDVRARLAGCPSQQTVMELEKTIAVQQIELEMLRSRLAPRRPWFAFWR